MKHSSVSVLMVLFGATALLSNSSAATAQQQEARESARAAAIAASKAYGSQERVVIAEPARSFIDWGGHYSTQWRGVVRSRQLYCSDYGGYGG